MSKCKNNERIVYQAVLAGELEIDKQGRIWRIAARRGNRQKGGTRLIPCHRRRAEHDSGQYFQVRVMVNWKRTHALAHRLVYHHLRGPIPEGLTINHINGDKKDNRPENLELATYSEQSLHAVHVLRVGRLVDQWGAKNHASKLTSEQVSEIRQRRAAGEKLVSIASDYGVAYQTISRIARGERRSRG